MTDDEILLAAKRITARRAQQARLDALENGVGLMIRWDVLGAAPGASSYTSVPVTADEVREIVRAKIQPLIDANT